ncbi:MAG: sigma 54-interacting transcriptional regulator [Bryobacteraceae bacterium]
MAPRGDGAVRQSQISDLQLLVDSAPSLIHTSKPDGHLDFFNQTWLRYVGQSLEDLEGWKWTAFIHPEDVEGIVQRWRASLARGEPFLYEARVLRADSEYRWMLHHKVAIRDGSGQIVKWYGSSIDIEDRKRAEEQLRRSSQELERSEFYLAEGQRLAHVGSWAFDPAGFEYWSPELFRMHGLNAGSKPPALQEYLDCIHPQDRESMATLIQGLSAQASAFDATKRIVRPNGEVRYIRCVGAPTVEHQRLKKYVGSALDVTEQELVTQELRRREAYLADAQRLSHTGSFGWRPDDGELVWSDETYRIFDYEIKLKPTVEAALQRVHPEDRALVQQVIDRASETGTDFEHEYRLLLPDGRVKHVHAIAHAIQNASGDREFIGAVTDITQRKAAEDKIREQEIEFRQILDLAPQLVAVYGPNRERLYANRVMLDYLGFSLEEWLGRFKFGDSLHPDDWERATDHFDRAVSSGAGFELELRLRKGDGSYRWFLARCNEVCDDKGQIMRWYLACTDIEGRKRAEHKLQEENVALREEIDKASMFEEIVGTSRSLKAVLSRIAKVAPTDSTVLITGETGTGKELIARAIHKRSQRSGRPFVSVNCAALPPTLVLSELFGHEKGAFTGATQRRLGRFEMADGGTIFLDEVGELLPDAQAALLRVLQEREFERVGGGQPIHTDVRVIAATNRDLNATLANGTFRRDLLYRLNVFPIEMPPLRERKDDILMLVEYFVQRYANRAGKNILSIDQKTLDLLQSYDWPGNIRELQNVIERSIILSSSDVFSVDELWLSGRTSPQASRVQAPALNEGRTEREIIEAALAYTRGRVSGPSGAAAKLGMPPSTLEDRIKTLKINKQQFKFGERFSS